MGVGHHDVRRTEDGWRLGVAHGDREAATAGIARRVGRGALDGGNGRREERTGGRSTDDIGHRRAGVGGLRKQEADDRAALVEVVSGRNVGRAGDCRRSLVLSEKIQEGRKKS